MAVPVGNHTSVFTIVVLLKMLGMIPIQEVLPPERASKYPKQVGWGQVMKIGVGTDMYDVPFLRPSPTTLNGRQFWALPGDLEVAPKHHPTQHYGESKIPCPPVDYRRGSAAHKKRKRVRRKKKGEDTEESSASASSDGGSDEEQVVRSDVAPQVEGEITKWGANFDHCVPSHFAVIQTTYDGDHAGVSVIRVCLCSVLYVLIC